MQGEGLARTVRSLSTVAAMMSLWIAVPDARAGGCHYRAGYHGHHGFHRYHHGYHPNVMWRHRGLGEAGYRSSSGVRRYHGLGDGYCSRYGFNPFLYWPHDRVVIVIDHGGDRPSARGYSLGSAVDEGVESAALPMTRREHAWRLLAWGDARGALREFAILALRSTRSGEPKVGYGLASAMLGRDEIAVWAFRRALDIEPGSLRAHELDEALAGRIRALIGHFSNTSEGDALFMVAALHYVLGEDDAARAAITAGDPDAGTQALRELLSADEEENEIAPQGAEQLAAR